MRGRGPARGTVRGSRGGEALAEMDLPGVAGEDGTEVVAGEG